MTLRRLVLAALAALGLLALSGAAAGAPVTDAQVRACVVDNLIRYDPPDRAVIVQYYDIEGACRAQLEGAMGADVTVVPLPAGSGGGEEGTAGSSNGRAASETPAAGGAADGAAAEDSPGRPRAGVATALPAVRAALQREDAGGVASPSAAADAPVWLIVIVAAALLAAAGCAWWEVRRRRS